MATRTHPCPGGCGAEISRERLSCPADWYRLPQDIRDRINRAYRRRLTGGGLEHARVLSEAFRWYKANPRIDTSQANQITSQS